MLALDPRVANRQKLCAALRDPSNKQSFGEPGKWTQEGAPTCFWGLAFRIFKRPVCFTFVAQLTHLAPALGLSISNASCLAALNDFGTSFFHLADILENHPLHKETDFYATEPYELGTPEASPAMLETSTQSHLLSIAFSAPKEPEQMGWLDWQDPDKSQAQKAKVSPIVWQTEPVDCEFVG